VVTILSCSMREVTMFLNMASRWDVRIPSLYLAFL